MSTLEEPPRWRYRFRNFSRAYSRLQEAAEANPAELSDLEREGLVQRFEYTFALAWKTMKDRLEHDGMRVEPRPTPRNVIRTAFETGMIGDGQAWIDMLTDRNAMSHEYDAEAFEAVADKVHQRYLGLFGELWKLLAPEEEGT
ncbi:MAG: nucleotidyltransferase [Gemmatimonadetes bacterium]|nr:nucleotidyltransferase [Gemmatimonadota bacterium]